MSARQSASGAGLPARQSTPPVGEPEASELLGDACDHSWVAVDPQQRGAGLVSVRCLSCAAVTDVVETTLDHEYAVADAVGKLKVREEAKRRNLAEANPLPTFTVLTSNEAAGLGGVEAHRWLVHPILTKGSVTLLTAQHKIGKSTLLQNLALALCNGRELLGWGIPEPYARKVLYANFDESPEIFGEQLQRLGTHENFLVVHAPPNHFNVANEGDVRALGEHCKRNDVGVLILDVWGAIYTGEESDNAGARAAMNNVLTLRADADIDAIIVVAHAGWSEKKRIRGPSSVEGAVDVLWRYYLDSKNSYMFEVDRSRIPSVPPLEVLYDYRTHSISRGASGAERMREANAERQRSLEDEVEQRVRDVVAASPRITSVGIQETVGGSRGLVTKVRRKMVDAGTLIEEREGNGRLYTVAPLASENAAP